jgi:hypothetical protein
MSVKDGIAAVFLGNMLTLAVVGFVGLVWYLGTHF